MLKNIPIKKEYALIIGTMLLAFIGYKFAFSNMIVAWQLNQNLKEKINSSSDLTYQPGYLERKKNNLNRALSYYKADTTAFRNNIISRIALIAEKENVKLSSVPFKDLSYENDHFMIEKIEFDGDYFSLLKLLDELEKTNGIGMVRSTDWKLVKVYNSNTEGKKLCLNVYLEISKV